jgi:hypothetical protein
MVQLATYDEGVEHIYDIAIGINTLKETIRLIATKPTWTSKKVNMVINS